MRTMKVFMLGVLTGWAVVGYGVAKLGPEWLTQQGVRWTQASLSYQVDYTAQAPTIRTADFSEYGLDYTPPPKNFPTKKRK